MGGEGEEEQNQESEDEEFPIFLAFPDLNHFNFALLLMVLDFPPFPPIFEEGQLLFD